MAIRSKTSVTSHLTFWIVLAAPAALLILLLASRAGLPLQMSCFGLLSAVFCVVSFLARKNALGGWLLFYLLEVYGNMAVAWIFLSAPLIRFDPARWDDKALYLVFMTTTIPDLAALFFQVALSVWLILQQGRRNTRMVYYLKLVLAGDLVFSLLALPIDILYWPQSVGWDMYSLGWPLVWLLYFTYSRRVRKVFVTTNWDSGREV